VVSGFAPGSECVLDMNRAMAYIGTYQCALGQSNWSLPCGSMVCTPEGGDT
jgi:hypothetical protein